MSGTFVHVCSSAPRWRRSSMDADDYIYAARVPKKLKPQVFGHWKIERLDLSEHPDASAFFKLDFQVKVGFSSYTLLKRTDVVHPETIETMHLTESARMAVVMEDSRPELRKHLPIWLNATGDILVTGLGLGCVVRGLLASKQVNHITVVEIDKHVLRVVGHEFHSNHRVRLVHGDAFKVQLREKFDYAWHDLWTHDPRNLQLLHVELLHRFRPQCRFQGAWGMERWFKRRMPSWVLR